MADIEPPSFSLGLDLDADSEPRIPIRTRYPLNPAPDTEEEEEEGFGAQVMDSDPESGSDPPRILKRLRRGPVFEKRESEPLVFDNGGGDDDIEEFSSHEEEEENFIKDGRLPKQLHSVCSSSKVPLHGRGFLTTQSSSQWKVRKREKASAAPDCKHVETGRNGSTFPKLTISPLRKFQLIDSDSDSVDPSGGEGVSKKVHENEQQSTASEQRRKASVGKPENEDLWKDFCQMKSLHIPTPTLDEFCEEYSRSVKNRNAAQTLGIGVCLNNNEGCHQITNSDQKFEQCWDLTDPLPPAHRYFFHDDPRIQKLVRTRLPNFFPLGIVNRGNQQSSGSVIDYMSQFTNGEASKQKGTQKINSKKNSARGRNKSRKSNAEEVLLASEGWVDPKHSATVPKDAGKRRVHATGQPAGHWFTGPDGRKVYVSRSGQELTGQIAYRHYRKENGTGFRKSKKKTSAKKKKG